MTIPVPQMDDAVSRIGTSLARAERRLSQLERQEFPIPVGYRLLRVLYYYYNSSIVETYTPGADVAALYVEVVAGGGGGGRGIASGSSGGGGGGGYAASLLETLESSYDVLVGGGGTGGVAGGADATGGGLSSFGANVVVAVGGEAGATALATATSVVARGGWGGGSENFLGPGAIGNIGDFTSEGSAGGWGIRITNSASGFGGGSVLGLGATGKVGATATPQAGDSALGFSYGGGGGGSIGLASGGEGANGIIIVWELANNLAGGTSEAAFIQPATTVEDEVTYGQSSAVGIETKYAREDHTHGTPPHDNLAYLTGVLQATQGGTGLMNFTPGDIIYCSTIDLLTRLPIGAADYALKVIAGMPAWARIYYQQLQVNSIDVNQRGKLNLIAGANISLTPTDVPGLDRTNVVIAASGGGGGSGNAGTAYVNFGVFVATTDLKSYPNKHAQVNVIGQTLIGAGSVVHAWVRGSPVLATDHSGDEHLAESIRVRAGNIIVGTGFTIYAECTQGGAFGEFEIDWVWF